MKIQNRPSRLSFDSAAGFRAAARAMQLVSRLDIARKSAMFFA
jgi:hypothetical protein